MSIHVETFADGFGNWHAYVKEGSHDPQIAAWNAIADELAPREQRRSETEGQARRRMMKHVTANVSASITQDRAGFAHFVEQGDKR